MTWNSGVNEEPVKMPEEMPQGEETKAVESKKWWEKEKTPEPSTEQNAVSQGNAIVHEASHEEVMQDQIPPVVPEAVENKPLTWLKSEEEDELKSRWNMVQVQFVDEPRKSVEQADALVEEVLKRINQAFTDQRAALDAQWVNHEEVSTEDLRITLQSYRSFFNRFLTF